MIILDASVLIGHLDGGDEHHQRARRLLEESGGSSLGASPISLAETLVAPSRAGRLDSARDALERIGVVELALGPDSAARLAQLWASTGGKLPDCCVLLAAQEHQGAVASFDSALVAAARTLGLKVV